MFVGVGAARVRDLFEQAKRAAKTGGKGAIILSMRSTRLAASDLPGSAVGMTSANRR